MLGTKTQILFNIVTFLIIAILLYASYNQKKGKVSYYLASILILLFCVYSFWGGDYFHYLVGFNERGLSDTHVEPIYIYLARYMPSYTIWRIVIWGCALLILLVLFKSLNTNSSFLLLSFTATSLLYFSYGRASLCMAILFLGFFLLSSKKQVLIGLSLVLVSYVFHRSAVFGIALALIAWLVPIKNFKMLFFYTIVFGIAAYFLLDWVDAFMELDADYEDTIGQTIVRSQGYLNKDESVLGFGGLLRDILTRISIYLSLLLYIIMIWKKEIQELPKSIIAFSTLSFLMILAGTLFLFNTGFNTMVVYDRFLQFAAIPSTIYLSYCFINQIRKNFVRFSLILGFIGSLYTLLYAYHCAL